MYQEPEFSCEAMIQMLAGAFSPSRVPAIQVRVEAPTSADARVCFRRYFQELSERFDGGFDPDRSNPAQDEDMTPPAGFFVMARLNGRPAGCGVLKIGDGAIGEIKRMWTAPSARGKGVARAVLRKLEASAREVGLARGGREKFKAFPAHAGMNRRSRTFSTSLLCVPRTRGDEPFWLKYSNY